MNKAIYCLLFVFLLQSCGSIKKHNEAVTSLHSAVDLQSDVDAVYKQLQKYHPKLYQYISKTDLDYKFDSLKTTITTPLSSHDFYEKLAPVLKEVRQGHIAISPPQIQFTGKERKALQKKKFEFYDLDFDYYNGKLRVSESKTDSTLIGLEAVKFANENTQDLINKYKTQFASDGYNTTLYNRQMGKSFQKLYFRDKGFLDSLSVTFKRNDSLFTKIFRRISKDSMLNEKDSTKLVSDSLKIKKISKEEKLARKQKAKEKRRKDRVYGFEPSKKQYTRNLNFANKDSTLAVMKIRSFSNGNYKRFYRQSFELLDSLKTPNLILDLRNNGGGRISEIAYLYSYLALEDYQFITKSEVTNRIPFMVFAMSNGNPLGLRIVAAVLAPVIVTHNLLKTSKEDDTLYYKFKYVKIKSPKELNYHGNLYVLINGSSFSASSILSTNLQATNRATFIGEETGGAYNGTVAGIYRVYKLPTSLIKVRMGLMQVESPYKTSPDGYGIQPDIPITPTFQDILNEEDPELNWVLRNIEKDD